MSPEELSRALREGDEPLLQKRRWVVGLAVYNIPAMSAISLYQMGLLRRVPEVHLPGMGPPDQVNTLTIVPGASPATLAAVPLAWPKARAVWKHIRESASHERAL